MDALTDKLVYEQYYKSMYGCMQRHVATITKHGATEPRASIPLAAGLHGPEGQGDQGLRQGMTDRHNREWGAPAPHSLFALPGPGGFIPTKHTKTSP